MNKKTRKEELSKEPQLELSLELKGYCMKTFY